jgi:hypothetical protein
MYAMRTYGVPLNNWGKNMNLSLIGSAIVEYEKERSDISALEESKAPAISGTGTKPQTENLITMPADWKELCEVYYQDYLNNRFVFSIMPYQLYDEFVKLGWMADDAYEDWMQDARSTLLKEFQMAFDDTNLDKLIAGESEYKVEQRAKKLAVQFLYKTAKGKGFKNLFAKVKQRV